MQLSHHQKNDKFVYGFYRLTYYATKVPSTDTFLIERLALDDQAAFENLHERYFARLFNHAVRKTGSLPAEARRPIYEPVSVAFSDA